MTFDDVQSDYASRTSSTREVLFVPEFYDIQAVANLVSTTSNGPTTRRSNCEPSPTQHHSRPRSTFSFLTQVHLNASGPYSTQTLSSVNGLFSHMTDHSPPAAAAKTVGFRLSDHYASLLAEAASRAGISPHGYARFVLIQFFERSEELQTKEDLSQIRATLETLRADFNEAINS